MAIVSAKEQLIALFNAGNTGLPNALVESDVSFGAATAYTPADGEDTRNTKLTITAEDGSANFTGSKELHYTRLALSLGKIEITPEDDMEWLSSGEAIATLNAELQKIHPDDEFDIDDFNAGTVIGEMGIDEDTGYSTRTYVLAGTHIKWLENATLLVVTRKPKPVEKTDLSATNGELNGFTE